MSEKINVTITSEDIPISIEVIEQPPTEVKLYPVTVAHPETIRASQRAEEAAQAAQKSAQEAQDAVGEFSTILEERIESLTTTDIPEGDNLYFTEERFDAAFSASTEGISTEAKQDELLLAISLIAKLTETQPVSLESVPKAPALVPSFQEINNLSTVAQTFVAPENARWCKIMTDDDNEGNIRVKIGGEATLTSGMKFQAGRSEDFQVVGDISVIAMEGANNKIQVIFGV